MPSIRDAQNADLEGYKPADPLPALPALVKNTPSSDVFNRCPLPPFNIDPDTLRQFENTGSGVPQLRVIPLPAQSGGTNTTITNSASSSSSSSSSGGGGSTSGTSLSVKSVNFTTGSIAIGGWVLGTVTLSESFQPIALSANGPCEVRLYGSSNTQSFDAPRPVDAPAPAETIQGLIFDVIFDTSPFTWGFQNIIGANQDATQSATGYITVLNTGGTTLSSVQVSLSFVPLET